MENFPAAPAETWTRDFSITSPRSNHWAMPAPLDYLVIIIIDHF